MHGVVRLISSMLMAVMADGEYARLACEPCLLNSPTPFHMHAARSRSAREQGCDKTGSLGAKPPSASRTRERAFHLPASPAAGPTVQKMGNWRVGRGGCTGWRWIHRAGGFDLGDRRGREMMTLSRLTVCRSRTCCVDV